MKVFYEFVSICEPMALTRARVARSEPLSKNTESNEDSFARIPVEEGEAIGTTEINRRPTSGGNFDKQNGF